MAAMLPILTAAGLAGGFSAVLALVVSQIRQRSVATEEEAPAEVAQELQQRYFPDLSMISPH